MLEPYGEKNLNKPEEEKSLNEMLQTEGWIAGDAIEIFRPLKNMAFIVLVIETDIGQLGLERGGKIYTSFDELLRDTDESKGSQIPTLEDYVNYEIKPLDNLATRLRQEYYYGRIDRQQFDEEMAEIDDERVGWKRLLDFKDDPKRRQIEQKRLQKIISEDQYRELVKQLD